MKTWHSKTHTMMLSLPSSHNRNQWLLKEEILEVEGCPHWLTLNHSVASLAFYESPLPKTYTWIFFFFFFFPYSGNNKGGLLVHFWIVFVMPNAKGHIFCEDCVAAILKDSIQTSIINRTSVGSLQGLAVDMDSVVLNGDCWVILLHAFLPAALLKLPLNTFNIIMKYSFHNPSERGLAEDVDKGNY